VLRRPLEPGQYTSIAFTDRLDAAGVDASVGSVGDAFDNALAESTIGLYKTELIKPRGPWRSCDQVEIVTLEYVDWYNHRRPHSGSADLPPAALRPSTVQPNPPHRGGHPTHLAATRPGVVHLSTTLQAPARPQLPDMTSTPSAADFMRISVSTGLFAACPGGDAEERAPYAANG
jgi:hypothetical protein